MASVLAKVIGHSSVISKIDQGLRSKHWGSATLFVGPSGVGKFLVAKGVAQALLCKTDSKGCGRCSSCQRIETETSENVLFIRPDGLQIKMEQSRELVKFLSLQKTDNAKVVIVDQADAMNPQAANALLKTLEEPPNGCYIILVAAVLQKVLPTIRSRCQLIRFGSLSLSELRSIATDAPDWTLRSAQGRMDLLQQLSTEDWQQWRERAFQIWVNEIETSEARSNFSDVMKDKQASLFTIHCWQYLVRDALAKKAGSATTHIVHADQIDRIHFLQKSRLEDLYRIWQNLQQLETDVLGNCDRSLAFTHFFIRARQTQPGTFHAMD